MSLSREEEERIAESQRQTTAEQIRHGAREGLDLGDPSSSHPTPTIAGSAGEKTIPKIVIRHAADVAAILNTSAWLLRPYLERNAVAVLYGDYGTLKSFVALDWSFRIAKGMSALGFPWKATQAPVLFVSAEGRSLPQRLRAWALASFPDMAYDDVIADSELFCIEHAINLSDETCARELVRKIDELRMNPSLVVIDTMTKNSDGRVEQSTADAGAYLAIIEHTLRAKYRCAVLLIHHVGHVEKDRIRGPIILATNTDTLIQLATPRGTELVATLRIERQKDSAPPPPQQLRAFVIDLHEVDDDGEPMSSVAIASSVPVGSGRDNAVPSGKAQQALLRAILALPDAGRGRTLAEIRDVGRKAKLPRTSAGDAAAWLIGSSFMTPADGGWAPASVEQQR